MTREQQLRSLRINGRPVKVMGNQMIVDHFDEIRYVDGTQVTGYKLYIVGRSEWNEVLEDKLLH
jgi:hypothetical protein